MADRDGDDPGVRGPQSPRPQNSGPAKNLELLHAGLQRRSLEAQNLRCAALTADPPAGLLENGDDVLALDVLEASRVRLRTPPGRRRGEIAELEAAVRRDDDRPLDDVLQLAHVPGPGVGGQPL